VQARHAEDSRQADKSPQRSRLARAMSSTVRQSDGNHGWAGGIHVDLCVQLSEYARLRKNGSGRSAPSSFGQPIDARMGPRTSDLSYGSDADAHHPTVAVAAPTIAAAAAGESALEARAARPVENSSINKNDDVGALRQHLHIPSRRCTVSLEGYYGFRQILEKLYAEKKLESLS
jgi:hypothetical protein